MTTIFGNPGSTELPLFRRFPADFRYVLGLQEAVVVGMADGYAQATRNAAFINLHSAVGLGHALGNIFTAFRNHTPLVITAGQQARSMLPFEPFLFAQQAVEFPRPYVKWSCEPARAADVPQAIERAYHIAMQAPCGPTFVSVPVDDWDQTCQPLSTHRVSQKVSGDPALLAHAARALEQSTTPALVVGAAIARDGAWDEVIALAERHQAAVWVSPMSARNSFPENHALFAGFLPADRRKIVANLAAHDLIMVLGAPAFTYHVEGDGPFIPSGAQLVQLIDNPTTASWTPQGLSIFTSIKLGIEYLLRHARIVTRPAPTVPTRAARLSNTRLTDAYLLQQIAALRPANSIIVEEAPSSRAPMHDHLPITIADGFYTCASGGLGHGLPAAMGVAMGKPGQPVIAVLGDGSSMYAIQGLWSAAKLGLPISFIIIKNNRYEALNEFGRHFGVDVIPGIDVAPLDFCGLARSQGVPAVSVTRVGELDVALRTAFETPHANLVEVTVEEN